MTELLLATEKTAAKMLDMKLAEFRRLVDEGALPPPARFNRWDVSQIRSIATGDAAKVAQELDL